MKPQTKHESSSNSRQKSRTNLLGIILKVSSFFIILEPIWMLLPFAGFLYGSVMHIEALSQNPYTALLVYFVFPTHTLFPLGLILILVGLLIFMVGAFQIYSGKITKKGLIKTGIYRKFRHPQYLALTIFGLGIILTWGRFITYIAFFFMLWLYYFLAKREEQNCRELFGREYDDYRDNTYFLFPGEDLFFAATRRFPTANQPDWARVMISFILVSVIAVSTGYLIIKGKIVTRNTLPLITGVYSLTSHTPSEIPLLMIKGPALQAAPSETIRSNFMGQSFEMLLSSPKIAGALKNAELSDNSSLLAFLVPGSNWYRESHRNRQHSEVNVFIFCVKNQVNFTGNNFREFRRNWQITHLIRAEGMSYERLTSGLDPVDGKVTMEPFQDRMEERIDFFLSGL